MTMIPHQHRSGFALLELFLLLMVVALICGFILTGLPGPHGPGISEPRNSMQQLALALESYYSDNGSYPPTYGYLDILALTEMDRDERENKLRPNQIDTLFNDRESCPEGATCYSDRYYVSRHFMDFLGNFGQEDLYDRFSEAPNNNDTDFDHYISRLEYVPSNGRDRTIADYSPTVKNGKRPFIYVPVNMRQFKNVARQWIKDWKVNPNSLGPRPDGSGPNSVLQEMKFPPQSYDAFILISMGPDENTRGLIYDIVGNQTPLKSDNYPISNYYYHIAGLATFFMATRDLNVLNGNVVGGDGSLDFEYTTRIADAQDDFTSNSYPSDGPGVRAPLIRIGGAFSRNFEKGLVD